MIDFETFALSIEDDEEEEKGIRKNGEEEAEKRLANFHKKYIKYKCITFSLSLYPLSSLLNCRQFKYLNQLFSLQ